MKNILYFFFIFIISCKSSSQEISKTDIKFQQVDDETKLKLIQLKNGKWGFTNSDYEIVIPFEYDDIGVFSEGLAYVKKNNKFGFYDKNGKLIVPLIYDNVNYFTSNGLSEVSKKGKWGFINKNGQEIMPIIYSNVRSEQLDNLVIAKKNKWAFFDSSGKQLSDFIYTDIPRAYKGEKSTFFKNGATLVIIDGKYEFLNEKLEPAFSNNKFDSATVFDTFQNAIVKLNGKYGMIKPNGNLKIPFEYDFIEYYDTNHLSSEYYNAKKGKVYSFYNKNLIKIGESYEPLYNGFTVSNPIISFKNLNGKFGVVDWEGNAIIPFIYDKEINFEGEKFAIAKRGEKFGIINNQNKEIFPFDFEDIYELDDVENLKNTYVFSSKIEEKIVNINGKVIISGYQTIHPIFYDHSKFIVKKNNKYGIVDLSSKILLPIVYDDISDWVEYGPEAHFIKINGKTGLIAQKTFKEIIPPIYENFIYRNGFIFASKQEKYGILNARGEVLCNFIFDEIKPIFGFGFNNEEERIYAKKENQYYEIDKNGKILKTISSQEFKDKTDRPKIK